MAVRASQGAAGGKVRPPPSYGRSHQTRAGARAATQPHGAGWASLVRVRMLDEEAGRAEEAKKEEKDWNGAEEKKAT